jgi:hypothetical protein
MVGPANASKISDTAATLKAGVSAGGSKDDRSRTRRRLGRDGTSLSTTFYFQYGTTTAYGLTTRSGKVTDDGSTPVSAKVNGLTPQTTYHFRAVASNGLSTTSGPDATFRTLGVAPPPAPELGHTLIASAAKGAVLVKPEGAPDFQPLSGTSEIPVNSTIDATNGTVVLETALGGGDSQTGTFGGGMFQVRQPRKAGGMTTIALRGGNFAACDNSTPGQSGRLSRGNKIGRQLWGKDHGGRFKTSAKGSVATVRGTSWYTADRCHGTITRVLRGKVMVRERGTGRHQLLSRGQSFLAHYPH